MGFLRKIQNTEHRKHRNYTEDTENSLPIKHLLQVLKIRDFPALFSATSVKFLCFLCSCLKKLDAI